MSKLVCEVQMSLKAALKAGLGTTGPKTNGSNGDVGEINGSSELTGKLSSLNYKVARDDLAVPKIQLAENLSDSLPKPKLSVATYPDAANINEQKKGNAEVPSVQDTISLLTPVKSPKSKKAKPAISAQQYVSELDRFLNKQNEHLAKKVVLGVSSTEVERLVKLSATVRGRYIAKLLDLGSDGHLTLKESELIDLRRTRESHEELIAGLDILKNAISKGEIIVSGNLGN